MEYMILSWLGHSAFKMQDKSGTDGVVLITDPYDDSTGLKMPSLEADIVTISHAHGDHANLKAIRKDPFVISTAGEYDVNGILVEGIESFHDDKEGALRGTNLIYRIEIDDISVVHLGDLGHVLTAKQLDKLSGTDILIIPVGGTYTIDAKQAVEVVNAIEPRIVIPMHYKIKGLKYDIDGVEKFIKELGLNPSYEEKIKISKKELPQEDMELIVFNNFQ